MDMPSWLTTFLGTLTPYAPAVQLFAYTALTFTSIVVATVSLRFSYRQNYGWKPILLVSTHGLTGKAKNESAGSSFTRFALLKFEVWNRHTYPIVIDGVHVDFEQDILDHNNYATSDTNHWYVARGSKCQYTERVVVKNGEHREFELKVRMIEGQSLDAIDGMVAITVVYYDPRRANTRELSEKYCYHFKAAHTKNKNIYKRIRQLMGVEYTKSGA